MQEKIPSDWLGRIQHADDEVGLNAARRMAALLDQGYLTPFSGDSLPGHWYQILFSPTDPQSTLAGDGHPAKGDFLPPVPLPRRMLAGRRVRFLRPLRVGETVTRTSSIQAVTPKTGRSGPMCFVTVRHTIRDGLGALLVEEDQDIVYRAAADEKPVTAPAALTAEALPQAELSEPYQPDETLLFRYSAITFNSHRIHYDQPYTCEVEGYPALVVNGGLTTMKLWDLAARHTGRTLMTSRSRNLKPLFANCPASLHVASNGPGQVLAWALDANGALAMRIELDLGVPA